jgi:hypothetical protein
LKPRLAAATAQLTSLGLPRPEQGLLVSKRFYQMLGGHKDGARTERRLISRIGRRRVVTLRATVVIGDGS